MASLPKPRSRTSRPGDSGGWPPSGIHPVSGSEDVDSSSSSLLGLQAQASGVGREPELPESGPLSNLAAGLVRAANALRATARWWVLADFRRTQVPLLVLALGIWAMSARWAWESQESATPLLVETISNIRHSQERAAMGTVSLAPVTTVRVVPPAQKSVPQPATATLQPRPRKHGSGLAYRLVTSFRTLLLPEPTAPERVEGNPRRKVWVDLKTGLYYCPGADYYGYGGADRGKVMSQKDAQYEYFQPATGAPCD